MTPDSTGETVDGMSQRKIKAMIDALRQERWRWTKVETCPHSQTEWEAQTAWNAVLVEQSGARGSAPVA